MLTIITVIMILGLSLSAGALSTSKQFKKTDDHNKAIDLAEMGITYYQKTALNLISDAKNQLKLNIGSNFCSEYVKLLQKNDGTMNIDNNIFQFKTYPAASQNNLYEVKLDTAKTTSCTNFSGDTVKIVFTSTGLTNTNEPYDLEGSFYVTKNNPNPVMPIKPPGNTPWQTWNPNSDYTETDQVYYGEYKASDDKNNAVTNKDIEFYNQAWFNDIKINGNRAVNIHNSAYFDDINNIAMNSFTSLNIDGDAIFLGPVPLPNPKNFSTKQTLCVAGKAYYNNNGTLTSFDNIGTYFNFNTSQCHNIGTWHYDNTNGIKVIYNP